MQLIGTCQINKKDKKGNLLIAIPLFPKADLFLVANNKKDKENSPDFLVFITNVRIGALWKNKFEKDGESKNYLAGSIFTLALPDNSLKIVIFEDKTQKEGIWSGSIFWSDGKKELDQSIQIEENQSDDSNTEEIF